MLAAQSCPTLCDPMDSVHRILQARILKWLAIPFLQGIFQNQGSKPRSPTLQTDSLASEPLGATFFQKKEKSSPTPTETLQGLEWAQMPGAFVELSLDP